MNLLDLWNLLGGVPGLCEEGTAISWAVLGFTMWPWFKAMYHNRARAEQMYSLPDLPESADPEKVPKPDELDSLPALNL